MNTQFNTKKRGIARTIIFKSGGLFRAVCLDFDIIEEAQTREKVEKQIREAIAGYIKNVCKNDLDDALLNRYADKKYWDMWNKYQKLLEKNNVKNRDISPQVINASIFTMPINARALCGV